ncbi:MAG: Do family serine endopeptidase [Gammaproteobacteria bacterium]|nr:Do family serine endopeptidase [Gammaproteobacteria bacterium]
MLSVTGTALAVLPVAVDGEPLPSLAPVLKRVTPSVVNINTKTRVRVRSPLMDDPFFRRFFNVPDIPRERISQSLGSGVIVDADKGYVLTNYHVIAGSDEVFVGLKDGRSLEAELIGIDPDTDLAMVQIPARKLTALPLADSDELEVGDFVVAVGNPFGLGQTVTSGIVSALGRTGLRGLEYQNFIQTDASINPGNSGGALINLRGELVGINSAIFTPSGGNVGIGFAIPSSMARYVMDQLIEFGEVRRGTLGVYVQDLTPDLAGAFDIDAGQGVLVAEIVEDSAAQSAGLQPGDVIVRMGKQDIDSSQDFYNAEGRLALGDTLRVDYLREGKTRKTSLAIQSLPMISGEELDLRLKGAHFVELGTRHKQKNISGVLLDKLEPRSRLAREGLEEGDIIIGVARQRVRNLADFKDSIEDTRGRILLQISRGGRTYIARIE